MGSGITMGLTSFETFKTGHQLNYNYTNDPAYDAMYNKLIVAQSPDEAKRLSKEMDMYIFRQHEMLVTVSKNNPILWQPWVKGYSGEFTESEIVGLYYTRFWIDQNLKKSMRR